MRPFRSWALPFCCTLALAAAAACADDPDRPPPPPSLSGKDVITVAPPLTPADVPSGAPDATADPARPDAAVPALDGGQQPGGGLSDGGPSIPILPRTDAGVLP